MKPKDLKSLIKIAFVLMFALLLMLPAGVMAEDGETTSGQTEPGGDKDENGMHAGKHIEVQEDGTYIIRLDAFATGEATFDTVTVPADIILVLDVSGSMEDPMGEDSYEYTARPSQNYSYNDLNNKEYYYKDDSGNYHRVYRDYQYDGWSYTWRYYLCYSRTDNNGNWTYLTGTTTQNSRPTGPDSRTATIWTGVLYERTMISAPSKMEALKSAVNTFVDQVASKNAETAAANPDATNINDKLSRIAIVKFAGNSINGTTYSNYYNNIGNQTYREDGYTYNYSQVVADLGVVTEANKQDTWKAKVNGLNYGGATSADYGIGYANAIIDRHANDYNYSDATADNYRSRVVVMFTDGEPNHSWGFDSTVANTTISTSRTLKTTKYTTVYTVAVYDGADPSLDPTAGSTSDINKYLHGVSSNYPNATAYTSLGTRAEGNHYFAATNASQLESIFKEIGQSSGSTTTNVGKEAIMKDIVSPAFTLPEGASEDDISVKIVRWNSTTHDWGNGEGYEFTPEQWATASTTYGATEAENVSVSISSDGKTVDMTGFDYKTHFKATSSDQDNDQYDVVGGVNKNTAKVVISFKILAKPSAVTGGSVATNGADSGIYVNGEPIIKFDVPEVEFTPVTYVVDYVTSDTSTDTKASTIKLDYSGVLKNVEMLDDPSDDVLIGEKAASFEYTIYKGKYGTISYGDDETDVQRRYVRYAPTTMDWDGYDRIFVKGESKTESNLDVWAMLCVLPANSVFYEDTFVTDTKTVTYNGEQVTIEYTGLNYDSSWDTVGTEGTNQTYHAGDEMGWISGLADDETYANDMSHTTNTAKAKATFTFSGTGVDIYSRTNGSTGTCAIKVKSAADDNESGKMVSKTQLIDTKAAAGDFFVVPVCTFTDLPYGKYTTTITVTSGGQKEGRMTFYLDGIRVYNPIKPLEGDANVREIYGEKNMGAVFTEVRSMLSTDATASALYIDEHTTSEIVTDVEAIDAAAKELADAQLDRDNFVEQTFTPAKNAYNKAQVALENAASAVATATDVYIYTVNAYNEALEAAGGNTEDPAVVAAAQTMAAKLAEKEAAEAAETAVKEEYNEEVMTQLANALAEAQATLDEKEATIVAKRAKYDEVNDGVVLEYSTTDVAEYNKEGPKSEVYLANGQQVAINVSSGKYYYIGLRSLNGDEITAQINGADKKLSHTADLYYEATPSDGTTITIKNTSDGILAITKLRTTGTGNTSNGMVETSSEEILAYVRNLEKSLASNGTSEYTGEILTEEETEEETVTEEILDESDVVIENQEEEVSETEEETEESSYNFLYNLMRSFFWFIRP